MKQITVLVDERPGVLAEITVALASRNINIESIVCDASKEHGAITLSVDAYDNALIALRDAGFQAVSENALVLRLPDRPGALAQVALRFKEANLSIFSMRILRRENGFSWVTLACEERDQAMALVAEYVVGAGGEDEPATGDGARGGTSSPTT